MTSTRHYYVCSYYDASWTEVGTSCKTLAGAVAAAKELVDRWRTEDSARKFLSLGKPSPTANDYLKIPDWMKKDTQFAVPQLSTAHSALVRIRYLEEGEEFNKDASLVVADYTDDGLFFWEWRALPIAMRQELLANVGESTRYLDNGGKLIGQFYSLYLLMNQIATPQEVTPRPDPYANKDC